MTDGKKLTRGRILYGDGFLFFNASCDHQGPSIGDVGNRESFRLGTPIHRQSTTAAVLYRVGEHLSLARNFWDSVESR